MSLTMSKTDTATHGSKESMLPEKPTLKVAEYVPQPQKRGKVADTDERQSIGKTVYNTKSPQKKNFSSPLSESSKPKVPPHLKLNENMVAQGHSRQAVAHNNPNNTYTFKPMTP